MLKRLLLTILFFACLPVIRLSALSDETADSLKVQEEIWALPTPLPILAYLVRPVGDGPFPLVIMNHGISLGAQERTMFPMVEYRDAALWFARRGYVVISPIRYGASSLDDKDQGLYGAVFAHVGSCDSPNFRGPGLAIATLNEWVINYMSKRRIVQPGNVVVVGQSGGGWGSIALASRNPSSVKAVITFAAGRGGRVGGQPNNNCAPDELVATTGEFGRTARLPMLWIYTANDSYFGPELTKRMHAAFVEAGGKAEYNLLPAFGSDGHFMIDSQDAVSIWSPLVARFLEKHAATSSPPPQQQASKSGIRSQGTELQSPRLNMSQNIHYTNWQTVCFHSSEGTRICRTTSTGADDLDNVVVRADLIESAGGIARLQLFVPQGANLQQGINATIDQGRSVQIPFTWCLTNICIAARGVDPALVAQLRNGQSLKLELTDLKSSPVSITLPLNQFDAAYKDTSARTYDFSLDEE